MLPSTVQVMKKPNWESVQEYKKYLKYNAPNSDIAADLSSNDTVCQCCGNKAPSEAAALIKIEDRTPTTIDIGYTKGKQMWICADCFYYGVRPMFVKFGDIQWNKEGDIIRQRAEESHGVPW